MLLYTTILIYKHIDAIKCNSPCNFSFVNICLIMSNEFANTFTLTLRGGD